MKACWCALPALNGNSDCCKNCINNTDRHDDIPKANFLRTTMDDKTNSYEIKTTSDFDWQKFFNNYNRKKVLDSIKESIDNLTIKELKELVEYMKKFESIVNNIK